MIRTRKQYYVTSTQAERFSKAVGDLEEQLGDQANASVEMQALRAQLHDLEAQLREYDLLIDDPPSVIQVDSLASLPSGLIKARIGLGLTQNELASRLDLKEQQIQRYEASEYGGARMRRVQEIVDAMGLSVILKLILPRPEASASPPLHIQRFEGGEFPSSEYNSLLSQEHLEMSREAQRIVENRGLWAAREAA